MDLRPETYVRRALMKSASKMKQWLVLLLCVVMMTGVMTQSALAAEPTGKCTNPVKEGIEYFTPLTILGSEVTQIRQNILVSATLADGTPAGTILGMDVEVTNDSNRYNCTIDYLGAGGAGGKTRFSCNSIPVNAIVNGVYFFYAPAFVAPPGTDVTFKIEREFGIGGPELIYATNGTVKMPPVPCARNLVPRDFAAVDGQSLVLYATADCLGNELKDQRLQFFEKYPHLQKYSIVNIMSGDNLSGSRVRMSVSPQVDFDYQISLIFGYDYNPATDTYGNEIEIIYFFDPLGTPKEQIIYWDPAFDSLTQNELPLTLIGGSLHDVNALNRLTNSGWGSGTSAFGADWNFEIKFWYENETGTLGYENSVFHFIRNLYVKMGASCGSTAVSETLFDPCQAPYQMFLSELPVPIEIPTYTDLPANYIDGITIPVSPTPYPELSNFWFMTRRCINATCEWVTSTRSYPYGITMSDGDGFLKTYGAKNTTVDSGTLFQMNPYGIDSSIDPINPKPFAIRSVYFVADEPGTYVIYAFARLASRGKTKLEVGVDCVAEFYVTVTESGEYLTCSTLANNGYFKAWWNDCLSSGETQLIPFEHIKGKEEAWIRNRSNQDFVFPFNAEYSYLPQKMEVASLNCKFEALEAGANVGFGVCHPDYIVVPSNTKVTITGGTLYLEGYPKYDEYRVAYMREDTMNISHLFFEVGVDECKNKKIPDTGISLRGPMSPLKVNESVNPSVNGSPEDATGYVFTGNSLRIPAIGLGMETPIPIVHVYYEDDSNEMEWDLSTLGNYVGELEGGSYIPYGGNSVLTGHYWSGGVFKNLSNLNYGDEIIIFANDGIRYVYQVVDKFIAQPDDVYEMFQQVGEKSLTLVTCENYNLVTNEYERRYIVRASIIDEQPYYETF